MEPGRKWDCMTYRGTKTEGERCRKMRQWVAMCDTFLRGRLGSVSKAPDSTRKTAGKPAKRRAGKLRPVWEMAGLRHRVGFGPGSNHIYFGGCGVLPRRTMAYTSVPISPVSKAMTIHMPEPTPRLRMS
jgi:hypothetical protein